MLRLCMEERTHSAAKRPKNKWRGSESCPTEEEVFGFMSIPIEGRYSVVTAERIRYAGLASMIGGGLEIVLGGTS